MSFRHSVDGTIKAFIISFIWLGILNSFVSIKLGGIAYIGLSIICMFLTLVRGKVVIDDQHRYMFRALVWLIVFCAVTFFGYTLLCDNRSEFSNVAFGLHATAFNIFKNIWLWIAGVLLCINGKKNRKIRNLFCLIVAYNIFITLLALVAEPNFSKNATANITTSIGEVYKSLGAMGFEFTYSLVIIIPLMLWQAVREKNRLLILLSVLGCYYVFKCSFLLALVALVLNLSVVALLLIAERIKQTRLFIVVFVVIVLVGMLVASGLIGNALIMLSEMVGNYELSSRLYLMGQWILNGDMSGAALARFDVYKKSVNGILKSPIIGMALIDNGYMASEHSTVLDSWCLFGIFGIIPFFMIMINARKQALVYVYDPIAKIMVDAAFLTFLFVSIINPILAGPQIMLVILWIIPMLLEYDFVRENGRWEKQYENCAH